MDAQENPLDLGDKVLVLETAETKRAGVAGLLGIIPPGGLCIKEFVTIKLAEGVRLDLSRAAVEIVEKYQPKKESRS